MPSRPSLPLDVAAFPGQSSRARAERTAVIGAGLAGLIAARQLQAAGHVVTVLEKSRGRGGRMSTRRTGVMQFDHGAQYVTARSSEFAAEVQEWVDAGAAARWDGTIVELPSGAPRPGERFVGLPGMSSIGRHLAEELDVRSGTRVATIRKASATSSEWMLEQVDGSASGPYDTVLISTPAAQAAALLQPFPRLASLCRSVRMTPCWAVLLGLSSPVPAPFDGAFVADGPLSWIARDSAKPGRGPRTSGEAWVLHATPEWSEQHLNAQPEDVVWDLVNALRALVPGRLGSVVLATAHLWRYAKLNDTTSASKPQRPCLWDATLRIGVAGDWLCGTRVEAAFQSGASLVERVLSPESSLHGRTDSA